MPHFFLKLIPPRPTFVQDMTPAEAALMQQHSAYLEKHYPSGKILMVGPVLNPQGPFGMAILEMESAAEAQAFGENDPTVKAGLNTVEVSPLHLAYLRK
jgi:uncharacterized protein YciI